MVQRKTSAGSAIAGISDDAVAKATGRGWSDWLQRLDAKGCRKLDHKGIVAVVAEQGLESGWWCQMVTVAYEQARGLREQGELPDGYSTNASRTIAAPVAELFLALSDPRRRALWLGECDWTIRKATANKSLRITWQDGASNVDVNLYAKGSAAAPRATIQLQHSKLKSAAAAAKLKDFWSAAFDRLQALLEGGAAATSGSSARTGKSTARRSAPSKRR